jgi:hypothetical protein
VEIEELPPQPVLARGGTRPGLTAAAAAIVLVLLLAVGLGALGGRPAPSPTAPALAQASQAAPGPPSADHVPLVTPAVACIPLPSGVLPEVRLAVPAGGIYPGDVEIQEWSQPGLQPTAPIVPAEQRPTPERLDIRADGLASLRTTDNACATAWAISLDDGRGEIELERFASPEGDPDDALQDWFTLVLAPFRGGEFGLHATLEFPGVVTRTTWPISVLPFDLPNGTLTRGKHRVEVVPGCNVELTLDNGYSERVNQCLEDVAALPEPAPLVVPGPPLTFRFPKDWYFYPGNVSCGSMEQLRFRSDPGGRCEFGWDADGISLSFELPDVEGTWTLAFDGCAMELLSDARNQACGTWYATIEARRARN